MNKLEYNNKKEFNNYLENYIKNNKISNIEYR